jgi:hypothetical protein
MVMAATMTTVAVTAAVKITTMAVTATATEHADDRSPRIGGLMR